MSDLIHRKPARRMSEVPAEVQRELTAGTLETKNLVEWLVVDRFSLFKTLFFKMFAHAEAISLHADGLKALQEELAPLAALKQSQRIGRFLSEHVTVGDTNWKSLAAHPSDIVREWAAITVGLSEWKFSRKLAWIKPFADADNAGLREIAWISLRHDVISQPVQCIQALIPWTGSRNERLRRFASEITRPCGVWAPYCPTLRETPELAIELLDPLMSNDLKYVRDSVANWLNDASKTSPDWVKQTTQRWLVRSNTPETNYIVRRGLRTIVKNESI